MLEYGAANVLWCGNLSGPMYWFLQCVCLRACTWDNVDSVRPIVCDDSVTMIIVQTRTRNIFLLHHHNLCIYIKRYAGIMSYTLVAYPLLIYKRIYVAGQHLVTTGMYELVKDANTFHDYYTVCVYWNALAIPEDDFFGAGCKTRLIRRQTVDFIYAVVAMTIATHHCDYECRTRIGCDVLFEAVWKRMPNIWQWFRRQWRIFKGNRASFGGSRHKFAFSRTYMY